MNKKLCFLDKTIKNKTSRRFLNILMLVKTVVELGGAFQCHAPVTKKQRLSTEYLTCESSNLLLEEARVL